MTARNKIIEDMAAAMYARDYTGLSPKRHAGPSWANASIAARNAYIDMAVAAYDNVLVPVFDELLTRGWQSGLDGQPHPVTDKPACDHEWIDVSGGAWAVTHCATCGALR